MCSFLCELCPPSACASSPWHDQQLWRAAALAGVSRDLGDCKCHWRLFAKKEGELGSRVLSAPFLVHQFKRQELPVLYLGYYLIPCGFWRNTFILMLGVRQEAGCASRWMKHRLCSGSYADPRRTGSGGGASALHPRSHTDEQQLSWERTLHQCLTFFLAWLLDIYVFLCLWREQQVRIQTLPECSFSIN